MKETVKELQSALEKMATEFYEQSGAKALNIEIRITPWETTHKIGLEFADGHANNAATAKAPGGCCHD